MKRLITRIVRFLIIKIFGYQDIVKFILFISHFIDIDLLFIAYQNRGILKYIDEFVSGENFVIKNVLREYIQEEDSAILFDIGANVGNYSKALRQEFKKSKIYVFEPNINTFKILKNNLETYHINSFNIGFSSISGTEKLYTYVDDKISQHASMHKAVFLDLHKAKDVLEIESQLTTIDDFCRLHQIGFIDFLKIDTEGHELAVLKGALKMISDNSIGIIQFEFNEMNIVARVFLKDFYSILIGYDIYRVDSKKLIPLLDYDSTNEIFKFQNFLAINRKIYVKQYLT